MQYLALDTPENRNSLAKVFPGLDAPQAISAYKITSPKTSKYNCIAWAMGFDDRWVDYIPDANINKKKWWPTGVRRGFLPSDLINAFEAVGFVCCDNDTEEDGYDKVALYKVSPYHDILTDQDYPEGWTHAAKVIKNGVYHSKIGANFDIQHAAGPVFHGTSYGDVYQIMKRKVGDKEIVEKIISQEPRIFIPENINNLIGEAVSAGMITLV